MARAFYRSTVIICYCILDHIGSYWYILVHYVAYVAICCIVMECYGIFSQFPLSIHVHPCPGEIELVDLCTPPRVAMVGERKKALGLECQSPEANTLKSDKRKRVMDEIFAEDLQADASQPSASQKKKRKRRPNLGKMVKTVAKKQSRDGKKRKKTDDAKKPAEKGEAKDQDGETKVEDAEEPDRKRKRTCKKKSLSVKDKEMRVVISLLARLGVTWQRSQWFHSRFPVHQEDVYACKDANGFKEMRTRLAEQKMPECLTCFALLKESGFQIEDLEAALLESGTAQSPYTKLRERLSKLDLPDIPLPDDLNQHQEETEDEGNNQPVPIADIDQGQPQEADGGGPDGEEADVPAPEPADVWKSAKEMKCLQVLPLGSFGKPVPVRCLACKSSSQEDGKMFNCGRQRKEDIDHFVKQHCTSATHQASVEEWIKRNLRHPQPEIDGEGLPSAPVVEKKMVQCEGLSLTHSPQRISSFSAEFILWASCSKLNSKLTKHKYVWDIPQQELVLFHSNCEKVIEETSELRQTCKVCLHAEAASVALKNALRFAQKHWIARVLQARLFKSEESLRDLVDALKSTALYGFQTKSTDELLAKNNSEMQQWIRKSFVRISKDQINRVFQDFLDAVVTPALSVNVADCNLELKQLNQQLASHLACGQLSEMGQVTAKIAEAACSGRFAQKPAFLGLICQFLEVMDREERGIPTMRKPRKMNDTERNLVIEAGTMLTLNGCNGNFFKTVGFNRKCLVRNQGKVDDLLQQSLPCPALSILWPDIMEMNAQLIDGLSPRATGQHARRFVMAFDFTYLLRLLEPMSLHSEHAVVGGAFEMKDLARKGANSWQKIEEPGTSPKKAQEKANRMLLGNIWKMLGNVGNIWESF